MSMILSEAVIEEAFERVLGRLAPATLQECIEEFSNTYPVLGTEEAFKQALGAKAPTVDPSTHDTLFLRFESVLTLEQAEEKKRAEEEKEKRAERRREAKTEKEKKAAKDEEGAIKAEVSAKMNDLKLVMTSLRDVDSDILAAATEIRKDARNSGFGKTEAVLTALDELEDIVGRDGEANRLVTNAGGFVKEAQQAARDNQPAMIEASTMAIEASRDRLRNILAIDLPEARNKVEEAITAAEDEKAASEKAAAIQKAVNDSADAVTTTEGIVKKVKDGVAQYRLDYLDFHGEDLEVDDTDSDNVDKLVERAEQTLVDAKEANARVAAASEADDKDAAETAAEEVVAERDKAQAELDKLDLKTEALKQEKAKRDIWTNVKQRKEKDKKEKEDRRFDQFLSSWKGHLTMLVLFLVGIVLVLKFAPWWVQIVAVAIAFVVLVVYGFSLLREEKRSSAAAILGGFFIVVLAVLFVVEIYGLTDKGPLVVGDTPTPTPTAEPTAQLEAVATVPPDETPAATEPPD